MRRVEIGRIVRSHGLDGRVKVLSYLESDRLLPSLAEGLDRPKQGLGEAIPHRKRAPRGAGHFTLKLGGVEDRTAADGLRGLTVSVPYTSLEPLPEGEYYWEDLIGLRVETEAGAPWGSSRASFRREATT